MIPGPRLPAVENIEGAHRANTGPAECPPIERLERLADGAHDASLSEHLARCPSCRKRLEEIGDGDAFLNRHRSALTTAIASASPEGLNVPGYRIAARIDAGGQGVVYKAVQIATKRPVALKLLTGGAYATPRQRGRFEREIELVAGLRHPNIVTVFDSGTTPDGRQYFAMEYVEGAPLDKYVVGRWIPLNPALQRTPLSPPLPRGEAGGLSVKELLALFAKVCDAVNYAHQRGIVHRDLKPGNILVDAAGEPRILDFGLAKASGGESLAAPAMSVTGEFMGTFAYASPEQAAGNPDQIDIRADVYSLGVILYEKLVGRHPYPPTGSVAEAIRNIAELEPPPPSALRRQVDHELDTMILKAMAKEPGRRYQTAGELRADIERYLAGEAIDAKRDSTWYLLRKTARRYRIPVFIAGAFLVLLFAFAGTMAVQARRLAQQRNAVQQEKQRAEAALRESTIERARLVNASGNTALAWRLVWPEFLRASNSLNSADGPPPLLHLPTDPAYWALWEIFAGSPCLATWKGPSSPVRSIVFEDDGRAVLVCFGSGAVWRWNTISGQSDCVFTPPTSPAEESCTLSRDGRNVIIKTGSAMEVWTLSAPAHRPFLLAKPSQRTCPVTCKDNRLLAYEGADGRLALYHLDSMRRHADFPKDSGNHEGATFASRGQVLVTSSDEGRVRAWDIQTASLIAERTIREEGQHAQLRIAESGVDLVVARFRTRMSILSVPSLADVARMDGRLLAMDFSPRGDRLASTESDRTVRIWNLADYSLSTTYSGHEAIAQRIAWSPDSERIAVGDEDGMIRLWSTTPRAARFDFVTPNVSNHGVCYSPDGGVVATCGAGLPDPDSNPIPITVWDAVTRRKLRSLTGHASGVSSIVFSPDGTRLASTGMDSTLRLWDIRGEREISTTSLPRFRGITNGRPAFSPDGKRVIVGCLDGRIRVFETPGLSLIATLEAHGMRVPCVDVRPDGAQFASASKDGTAGIWDAQSFKLLKRLEGQSGLLRVVRYSHDGRVFATGGDDWKVIIWDAQTGSRLRVLERHRQMVFSLAFSPDDRILASGDNAGTIHLWDARNGRNLATVENNAKGSGVFGLDFSPDGRTLVAAREHGGVAWWDLTHHDRHIAGNLEYQLLRNSDIPLPSGRVAELRRWAEEILKRAASMGNVSPADVGSSSIAPGPASHAFRAIPGSLHDWPPNVGRPLSAVPLADIVHCCEDRCSLCPTM